ncbi:hypothetical protein [Halobacillus salinus]|uniref:Methyltransferase n=1 Tax=Halobacillus salinus TaxID=192814 RepID=A0A4Z0H0Q2_9BACI|nr:hypothetical protein [Halobacillus salinus]TGB03549.1 hypothetical protein E4663_00660 [Halobacillus salinus]
MCPVTPHESLNNEKIVNLYYFLLTNIYLRKLSESMFHETSLLEATAKKRGFHLNYYKKTVHPRNPIQILILVQKSD